MSRYLSLAKKLRLAKKIGELDGLLSGPYQKFMVRVEAFIQAAIQPLKDIGEEPRQRYD